MNSFQTCLECGVQFYVNGDDYCSNCRPADKVEEMTARARAQFIKPLSYQQQLDTIKAAKDVDIASKGMVLDKLATRQCFQCKQPIPKGYHCDCEMEYVK